MCKINASIGSLGAVLMADPGRKSQIYQLGTFIENIKQSKQGQGRMGKPGYKLSSEWFEFNNDCENCNDVL